MLISPAYAQDAGGAVGAITQFLPLILIFAVFYFLLIRPQQQKQKEMRLALAAIKRGDRVVTAGGVLATVTRAPKTPEEREIEVEIAQNVRVIVLRETISAVINPTPANDARPARPVAAAGGTPAASATPDIVNTVKAWFAKDKKKG
jgi:preprotein translocase subunit YajC